jgi:hypothetical protein
MKHREPNTACPAKTNNLLAESLRRLYQKKIYKCECFPAAIPDRLKERDRSGLQHQSRNEIELGKDVYHGRKIAFEEVRGALNGDNAPGWIHVRVCGTLEIRGDERYAVEIFG